MGLLRQSSQSGWAGHWNLSYSLVGTRLPHPGHGGRRGGALGVASWGAGGACTGFWFLSDFYREGWHCLLLAINSAVVFVILMTFYPLTQ